jgi:hypothetical protein
MTYRVTGKIMKIISVCELSAAVLGMEISNHQQQQHSSFIKKI